MEEERGNGASFSFTEMFASTEIQMTIFNTCRGNADIMTALSAHLEKPGKIDEGSLHCLINTYAHERVQEERNERFLLHIEMIFEQQRGLGNLTGELLQRMIWARLVYTKRNPNNIAFLKRYAVKIIKDDGHQVILQLEDDEAPVTRYYPRETLSLDNARQVKARREASRLARLEAQPEKGSSSSGKKSASA